MRHDAPKTKIMTRGRVGLLVLPAGIPCKIVFLSARHIRTERGVRSVIELQYYFPTFRVDRFQIKY